MFVSCLHLGFCFEITYRCFSGNFSDCLDFFNLTNPHMHFAFFYWSWKIKIDTIWFDLRLLIDLDSGVVSLLVAFCGFLLPMPMPMLWWHQPPFLFAGYDSYEWSDDDKYFPLGAIRVCRLTITTFTPNSLSLKTQEIGFKVDSSTPRAEQKNWTLFFFCWTTIQRTYSQMDMPEEC